MKRGCLCLWSQLSTLAMQHALACQPGKGHVFLPGLQVPAQDFVVRTVCHLEGRNVALVQTRPGYVNVPRSGDFFSQARSPYSMTCMCQLLLGWLTA